MTLFVMILYPNESQRDCDSSSGIERTEKESFRKCWTLLLRKGRLHFLKGKYSKGQTEAYHRNLQANIRGFGFVMLEGEDEDIFIPGENVERCIQEMKWNVLLQVRLEVRKEGKIVESCRIR